MSKATTHNHQPTDFARPPPSYEATTSGPSHSTEPLLGEDRSRHSEDDIPDDFKYSSHIL